MSSIFHDMATQQAAAPQGNSIFHSMAQQTAAESEKPDDDSQGPVKIDPKELAFNQAQSQQYKQGNALEAARKTQQAQLDSQGPLTNMYNSAMAHINGPGMVDRLYGLMGQKMGLDAEEPDVTTRTQAVMNTERQKANQEYPNDPTRVSGQIGAAIPQLAPVIAAGPLAPAVMTAQGAEGRQEEIEQRRAAGQDISPEQQGAYLGGGAILDYGLGSLMPGSAASKAILGDVANPLARVGVSAAVGAPEMGLFQAGNNVLKQVSQVNPDQDISEGVPGASVQGAALGAGGSIFHEMAAQAAKPAAPVEPEPFGMKSDEELDKLAAASKAAQAQPKPEPVQAEPANPLKSAREQHAEQLQEFARQNNLPVPEATPGLHTEETPFATHQEVPKPVEEPTVFKQAEAKQAAVEPKTSEPAPVAAKTPQHNEDIRDLAATYAEGAGIDHGDDTTYAKVDEGKAKQIASDYEAMEHNPDDPKVKASYDALKAETLAQYQHLKDAGYSFTPDATGENGYKSSADMIADATNNKHLHVFTGGDMPAEHPLAEAAPENPDGLKTYNDIFRAVHDVFGHAKEGVGFGPRGEENAWRQHAQMYSPEARGAMTAETRGQNSWVNFGPHGEENQANPQNTKYAEQKAGLLPEEHSEIEKPNVFKRLLSEEEGGTEALNKFADRDVKPFAAKALEGGTNLLKALDRHMDLGFSRTDAGKESSLNLRKTLGDATAAGHAFEDALVKTGARDQALKFSTDKAAALQDWDHLDAGGLARTPEERQAQDLVKAKRQENAARAAKLGVKLNDEEGDALSRIFVFPEGAKGSRSIAGPESFRKSQTYDRASDAYKAAEAAGGKPAYDNVWDMQMARQYEVERSLGARENLRAADKGGTIRWFPDGTKPDEGFDTKIQDKVATETRRMALPTRMVGQFSRLEGFEATSFLKDHAADMVDVRPGEQPPKGYAFSPKEARGSFYAPEDTAKTFNDSFQAGRGDPVQKLPGQIARALIMQRYGLSVVHAWNGAKAYLNQQIGTALSGALGKGGTDAIQGLQAVKNATIYGGWKRGAELQAEIEHPGTHPDLADVAKRVVESGPETKFKSVLDRSKWTDVANEFKEGNPIGGITRAVKAAADSVPDFIYHTVLDKLDLSVRRDLAERQIREGKTAEEGASDLAQAGDTISRALGRHVNSDAFKNSMITQVGKVLAPAFQYKTGLLRNALIEPLRGNPHAQAQLAGSVITTAIGGAALTAIMSYVNTGKVQLPTQVRDYWNPRTGNKDANGHDERMSMPGYEAFLMRSLGGGGLKGMADEAKGSLNPAITGAVETAQNKDFYGDQVRPEGGSVLGNTARGAAHIAKGALPISVMGGLGGSPEGDDRSWGMKLYQGVVGGTVSHPVTSSAEQTAYDILNRNEPAGRTPVESEARKNTNQWVKRLRAGEDQDKITDEMDKDPGMSPGKETSVFRRAREAQGLPGLIADTQFKIPDLAKIWAAATPEEQRQTKDGMEERIDSAGEAYDRMSPAEQKQWEKLYETVKGEKP